MLESKKSVLVTGASGVLGAAVYNAFQGAGFHVVGLSYSQTKEGLIRLDLSEDLLVKDGASLKKLFGDHKFNCVIHCAAERRPDAFKEGTPSAAAAAKLNKDVPGHLAEICKDNDATIVYISTDYVFDGTTPPYKPNSPTNPLQEYGITKLAGEEAVLGVGGARVVILRVPVLYGPAPNNSDSAINILVDIVQDKSGKTYKMDDYARRYPTNVLDIASFLVRLLNLDKVLLPVMHYSASECFTKYKMCEIFGQILGRPISHIIRDSSAPMDGVARPKDCQLCTEGTVELVGDLHCSNFEEWWTKHLTDTRK
ncbi:NAD(P)-binding protein [Gyrodon lividus]|nr:NAD(P)-binding protein [Gyrodon lividus]